MADLVMMQFEITVPLPGTAGVSPASHGSAQLVTLQAGRLRSQHKGASVFKLHQYLAIWVIWAGVFGVGSAEARPQVKVRVSLPAEVRINIESMPPAQEWSFRNAYAGLLGIAERVAEFQALGANGDRVAAKKIAVGEFRSERDVTAISYVVKIPPPRASDVAHVSWIGGKSGFLMPGDLLPVQLNDVVIEFSLPSGWTSQATIDADRDGKYEVAEPETEVFFVGSSLRRQSKRVEGVELQSVVSGEWPFKDSVVLNSASKVVEKYLRLTGF
ncbi:MAG TPA: hypothetical protein VFO72_09380, partial [Pyrinomonadaceae bacterium]|nr:hypothetical protein [Pyrinomonadaceae bacterium]